MRNAQALQMAQFIQEFGCMDLEINNAAGGEGGESALAKQGWEDMRVTPGREL